MSGFSTSAILLRAIQHGDYDLILTFLSQNHGKISAIAKNAKKSVRRFAGVLELFQVIHIVCTQGRGKLPILKEASLARPFSNIRGNIDKTAHASYWAQLIYQWLEEGRQEPRLYNLFHYVLEKMDCGFMDDDILSILFQIKFLGLSGFFPDFERCRRCAKPLDRMKQQRVIFDLARGGILCRSCGPENSRHVTLSTGSIKLLHWMGTRSVKMAERIKFSPAARKESLAFLETFLPYHLGFKPRSLGFIQRLRDETVCRENNTVQLKSGARGG